MKIYSSAKIAIMFLLVEACQAESLTVGQGDEIQARIDLALPGDIILLSEGTYYENLVINKSVTLQSFSR
jgi:nitrous oxidase accessory protein NosD